MPPRNVERDGGTLVTLFDGGRSEAPSRSLAGCKDRQFGRETRLVLGALLSVDRDTKPQARQRRSEEMLGSVGKGIGTACKLCLKMTSVACEDAMLRISAGIVVSLERNGVTHEWWALGKDLIVSSEEIFGYRRVVVFSHPSSSLRRCS